MSGSNLPTIEDVARAAGLSKSTVSRALNGESGVSRRASAAALEAAADLGYRRNSAATSLRTGASLTVGLVVSSIRNEVFAAMAQGMDGVLYAEGRTLFVATTGGDPLRERRVIQSLLERGVDGVAISSTVDDPKCLRDLEAAGVPTVLIDREPKSGYGHRLLTDHRPGFEAAVSELHAAGHTLIGLIGPDLGSRPGREARRLFHELTGMADDYARSGLLSEELGSIGTVELLSLTPAPTAFIAVGSQVTVGVLAQLGEMGFEVPRDLSLVVYDDSDAGRVHVPPLSTIYRDRELLGRTAARLILDSSGTPASRLDMTLPNRYLPRESVTPINSERAVR